MKRLHPIHNEKTKVKRLLFLGDYGATTGFATVSHNIIEGLLKIFGKSIVIHICGINYYGEPYQHPEHDNVFVFSARFSQKLKSYPDSDDLFGRNGFLYMLYQANADADMDNCPPEEMGYDGIFIIQDITIATGMVPILRTIQKKFRDQNKKNFKSMLYFPVDCGLIFPLVKDVEFFDTIVTYNEYSRNQVLKMKPELRGRVKVIPHGINTGDFYPMTAYEKKAFRNEFFGEHAGKDIIINLNRNQPRKDIPCTIFAFQEYKKKNPNAFLYLHMDPLDKLGWNLRTVMKYTSLEEDVDYMFPPIKPAGESYSTAEVNKIYNACDVYLTTSLGEGWGLGVTEAMGCKLPVIAPSHSSFTEIGGNGTRLYALENMYPISTINDNLVRNQCDYIEIADKLEEVFIRIKNFYAAHDIMVQKAYDYVQTLNWQGLCEKWADLIEETF